MNKMITKITIDGIEKTGLISDGYHTFNELYEHRIILFIALCKWLKLSVEKEHQPWRSLTHHDGSVFIDWFIMGIGKEKGKQITYHLPLSKWDETNFVETLEKAPKWDKHTPSDVLERLKTL